MLRLAGLASVRSWKMADGDGGPKLLCFKAVSKLGSGMSINTVRPEEAAVIRPDVNVAD